MEPTTPTPTTWQVWLITLAALPLLVIGVPLVASLPLPLAYLLAALAAIAIIRLTSALARSQR
ncbi:hypothetical protein ACYX8G_19515 [Microbacterium saperdae]